MENIGFIGLGTMGLPISKNLIQKSQSKLFGFDIESSRVSLFENAGGKYSSIQEMSKNCSVIFLCLPTNDLVSKTIDEIICYGKKETIIVDLSSTAPDIITMKYKEALEEDIYLIDAPVSGGEKGAIEGTLVIMCGGDKKVYDKIKPLLEHISIKSRYMGKSGNGSISKLVNNIIVGINIAAVSEGYAFAKKAGINPRDLFEIIKDGFAGSKVMDSKIPKILNRDFSASARMGVHQKDLLNAEKHADYLKVSLPLTDIVLEFMNKIESKGLINEDHCALIKIYEEDMDVIVSE